MPLNSAIHHALPRVAEVALRERREVVAALRDDDREVLVARER